MLTTLAFTVALAQETPQLSEGFRKDPVAIERFHRATRLAHAGQITTVAGIGVTVIGATIMVAGLLPSITQDRDPHASEYGMVLGGAGLMFAGGLATFVGPLMLYGFAGGARGSLRGIGLDVDGTMLYAAWGLWGGALALGFANLFVPDSEGTLAIAGARLGMTIGAITLGSLQLGVNRDAAAGAGIARRDRDPVRVAVAPWTDGHHAGALVAVGF